MEKRLPLALLMCLLFAYWWMSRFAPAPEQGGGLNGTTGGVVSGDGGLGTGAGDLGGLGPGGTGPVAGLPGPDGGSAGAPPPPDEPSTPVPLSGEEFHATFQTRGGGLGEFALKSFRARIGSDDELLLLGAVDPTRPGFMVRDFNNAYHLDKINWTAQPGRTVDGRDRIVFEHVTAEGLRFKRTVTASPDDYIFDLAITVTNEGASLGGTLMLVLGGPHGVVDEATSRLSSTPPSAIAILEAGSEIEFVDWTGGDLEEGDPRRVGGQERLVGAGVMTNYFASLIVPREGTYVQLVQPVPVLDRRRLDLEVEEQQPLDDMERERWRAQLAPDHLSNASVEMLLQKTMPAAGETVGFDFSVYAGPRDRSLARKPGYEFLQPVIDVSYGSMRSLDWINKSMLGVLGFFHGLAGNWGVAIILLTILVKGLLFPLNRVQQGSMARYNAGVKKLKPQVDALKEKYKGNQRKFNEEQMKLLREHGISPPLGGCLLTFLQFPVWFGLFQILRTSIELRHADFVFWVHDLSQPDQMPFGFFGLETVNLLPILMAIAMFAQMRFAPQGGGDEQAQQMQKVMGVLMPGMMVVFLYSYSSGLSLYIFVSSLLGIFEYRVIRKFWPPPTPETVQLKPKKPPKARPAGARGR